MCGIVGMITRNGRPVDRNVLHRMTDTLAHRGPDGAGTWATRNVGIGHRRLAIIDPVSGQQPMSSPDGRCHLTFNGEIYNFRELRDLLESLGHRFVTESDTEVVLASYRQWGSRCVERFRGMFAFGIVDLDSNTLFLARDHFGIKPLVFLVSGEIFAFASELQVFRAVPGIPLTVNIEAIDDYLQLLYIPGSETVFREVHKLRPGHTMTVGLDGSIGEPKPYWFPSFEPDWSRSEEDWIDALDEVLRDSVRAHLVADVSFGAFLSGGLDSAAVVGYMTDVLDVPVTAFTIGFDDPKFDETEAARRTAELFGVEHHIETLRPDALKILPDLVRHYGEPFGDSSAIPTYFVSKLAASSVSMVLSGDGGDELFAGYNTYTGWMKWLEFEGRPRWRKWLYPLAHAIRPLRYPERMPNPAAWLRFVNPTGLHWRKTLWLEDVFDDFERIPPVFSREFDVAGKFDPVQTVQYLDLRTYLPQDILTKVDGAAMMNSLEVRTPLVDHVVFDLVSRIPQYLNIDRSEGDGFEGKRLFKKLMSRTCPASVLRRPKKGFSAPVSRWLGPESSRTEFIEERFLDPSGPLRTLFQPSGLQHLAQSDNAGMVWQLLFLDEWLRQNNSL